MTDETFRAKSRYLAQLVCEGLRAQIAQHEEKEENKREIDTRKTKKEEAA